MRSGQNIQRVLIFSDFSLIAVSSLVFAKRIEIFFCKNASYSLMISLWLFLFLGAGLLLFYTVGEKSRIMD